jgi:hypothetical protein
MVAQIATAVSVGVNEVADRFGLTIDAQQNRIGYSSDTGITNSYGNNRGSWTAAMEEEILLILKRSTGGNDIVRSAIAAAGSYQQLVSNLDMQRAAAVAFAEGGVMGRGVSQGGIARSTTVAMWGEAGSEAFVPLRDDRVPLHLRNGIPYVSLPGGRWLPTTVQAFADGGAMGADITMPAEPEPPRVRMQGAGGQGGVQVTVQAPGRDDRETVRELRNTVRVLQAGFAEMREANAALRAELAALRRGQDPDAQKIGRR